MALSTIALAALAAAQAAAPQDAVPQALPTEVAVPATQQEETIPADVEPSAAPQEVPVADDAAALPEDEEAPAVAEPVAVPPVPPSAESSIHKGIVLWRNIEDGMTVAQLRALYPQSPTVIYKGDRTVLADVPIIEGCEAKVNVMHPSGVVKEIVMRGEGSIAGRCSLKIITALSGKYGDPLDKDKVKGSLFGREGKNYIWSRDGVTLQLKRYTNGPLGGGGLFAASWELRYSVNATNIDL